MLGAGPGAGLTSFLPRCGAKKTQKTLPLVCLSSFPLYFSTKPAESTQKSPSEIDGASCSITALGQGSDTQSAFLHRLSPGCSGSGFVCLCVRRGVSSNSSTSFSVDNRAKEAADHKRSEKNTIQRANRGKRPASTGMYRG